MYIIVAGAIPNTFDDVHLLATYDVPTIVLNDDQGNSMSLTKGKKYVNAYMKQGEVGAGHLKLLPCDYETYNIHVRALLLTDIRAIERWHLAEDIYIVVESRPSHTVWARVAALSATKSIRVTLPFASRKDR